MSIKVNSAYIILVLMAYKCIAQPHPLFYQYPYMSVILVLHCKLISQLLMPFNSLHQDRSSNPRHMFMILLLVLHFHVMSRRYQVLCTRCRHHDTYNKQVEILGQYSNLPSNITFLLMLDQAMHYFLSKLFSQIRYQRLKLSNQDHKPRFSTNQLTHCSIRRSVICPRNILRLNFC